MDEQDELALWDWYRSHNKEAFMNSLELAARDGWQAALEYERNDSSIKIAQAQALAIQERERSKKLVEALEYHVAYSAPSFTKSQLEDALREYRGEM